MEQPCAQCTTLHNAAAQDAAREARLVRSQWRAPVEQRHGEVAHEPVERSRTRAAHRAPIGTAPMMDADTGTRSGGSPDQGRNEYKGRGRVT